MKRAQIGSQHVDVLLDELLEADALLHSAAAISRDEPDDRAAAVLVALEILTSKAHALKKVMTRRLYAGLELEAKAAKQLLALPEFEGATIVLPDLSPGYSPDLILRQPNRDTVVEVKGAGGDLTAAAGQLEAWAAANAPTTQRMIAVMGPKPRVLPQLPPSIEVRWLA